MIRVSKPRTSDAKDKVKKIFKPQFLAITIHLEVPNCYFYKNIVVWWLKH